MNIAELFVNLGVTGTKKTKDALGEVKGGLKEAGSMALETKAAIIAAMYAVERMFSASNKLGSGLTNFNAELGVSTDTLQRYQYAAQQVGVSNETVAGSFKSLQSSMTKILMGEGIPKGLARVALTVGGMEPGDILEYQKNPEKLIQKLQEYAQKETNIGLRNENLKGFGLGDDMIAALSRNAFRPEVMQKAPVYSDREIKALDKNNAAWKNLGQRIEMAFGRFNAKHGGEIIEGITKIADATFRLIDALTQLAEKVEAFQKLHDVISFIADAVGFTSNAYSGGKKVIEGRFSEADAEKAGQQTEKFEKANPFFMSMYEKLFGKDTTKALMDAAAAAKERAKNLPPEQRQIPLFGPPSVPEGSTIKQNPNTGMPAPSRLVPAMPAGAVNNNQKTSQIDVNINQTNNFNSSPNDPGKVTQNLKDSARAAFRQSAAQTVGA